MATKYFFKDPDAEREEGWLLDEHTGEWSLVSAYEGNDGKAYMKWGFAQTKDRTPAKKGIPWKVTMSNRENLIEALEYFLSVLKAPF